MKCPNIFVLSEPHRPRKNTGLLRQQKQSQFVSIAVTEAPSFCFPYGYKYIKTAKLLQNGKYRTFCDNPNTHLAQQHYVLCKRTPRGKDALMKQSHLSLFSNSKLKLIW